MMRWNKEEREADTDILQVTVKAEELKAAAKEKEYKDPYSGLDYWFKEMIDVMTTYVPLDRDAIDESISDLVEGLRIFNERVGIKVFCMKYMHNQRNRTHDGFDKLMEETESTDGL